MAFGLSDSLSACFMYIFALLCVNSTQLNSTNHPKRKRVVYKRKEAIKAYIKAYINPRFFSKQSRWFLKVATVSQLINDTGKLFHTSISTEWQIKMLACLLLVVVCHSAWSYVGCARNLERWNPAPWKVGLADPLERPKDVYVTLRVSLAKFGRSRSNSRSVHTTEIRRKTDPKRPAFQRHSIGYL